MFRVIQFLGLALFLLLSAAGGARAEEGDTLQTAQAAIPGFAAEGRPVPRYVSLRSDKVYVRAGPAMRYPIKWIYKRAGMPVEIVQEFDNWRKVRGIDGEEGWVHQSMLSGERTVLIRKVQDDLVPMREGFSAGARMTARLEPMVVASIDKCAGDWCRVEAGGYRGWVQRNFLWGIYDSEEFK